MLKQFWKWLTQPRQPEWNELNDRIKRDSWPDR